MKLFYKLCLVLAIACIIKPVEGQSTVRFYTTMGEFTVMMYDTIVPITAGNFIDLTDSKYYDGVTFHRVIDNFMIQGGDPTGTGSGGPGYTIPDEFDERMSNVQKTISMANAGPNTGGSQFFINLVNNTYLDYNKPPTSSKHPVFGIVMENFDVVQSIGQVETDNNDRPVIDVVMDSVRVVERFVGLNEMGIVRGDLMIYPNPIDHTSVIELFSVDNQMAVLSIYSVLGALQHREKLSLISGSNKVRIENLHMKGLPRGEYILSIRTDTHSYEDKLLLQ